MTAVPVGAARPRPIRVTEQLLDDLGGGPSTPATVAFLRSAALAKHLHLLLFLVREAPPGRRAAAEEALAVIAAAQQAAPDAVDHLLSGPFTGAWLSSAARHRHTDPSYLDHLPALAVVAGLRAGATGELDVPADRGFVSLPGVGRVPAGDTVRVGFAAGRLSIDGSEMRHSGDAGGAGVQRSRGVGGPGLQRTRQVPLGDDCLVDFEDTDPFRACYHVPAADRQTEGELAAWRAVLGDAWRLLAERAPQYAAELAAGLRAVVPLVAEPGGPDVSATSRIAFGAVALSRPSRPDHAAATLVHEFQHSKLSALLDLVALHEADSERRYFAPWRRDARPVGGLLQGAYAFLAVGDLWRRLGTGIETLDASDRNYADLCEQLGDVLGTLRSAEALNEDGRRVVTRLSERFDALLGGAVPEAEAEAARARLQRQRRMWETFNFSSDGR